MGLRTSFGRWWLREPPLPQYDRKMIIEYVYGKAMDNPDALNQEKKIDFSIVNIFPGSDKPKEIEDVIDITPEDEGTESE